MLLKACTLTLTTSVGVTTVNYLCVCCTIGLYGKLSESEKLNEILTQDCLFHLTWGIPHLKAKWDAKLTNGIFTQRNLFLASALIGKHMSSTGFQIRCIFVVLSPCYILLQAIHLFALCMFCCLSGFFLTIFCSLLFPTLLLLCLSCLKYLIVFFFCFSKLESHPGNIP